MIDYNESRLGFAWFFFVWYIRPPIACLFVDFSTCNNVIFSVIILLKCFLLQFSLNIQWKRKSKADKYEDHWLQQHQRWRKKEPVCVGCPSRRHGLFRMVGRPLINKPSLSQEQIPCWDGENGLTSKWVCSGGVCVLPGACWYVCCSVCVEECASRSTFV